MMPCLNFDKYSIPCLAWPRCHWQGQTRKREESCSISNFPMMRSNKGLVDLNVSVIKQFRCVKLMVIAFDKGPIVIFWIGPKRVVVVV